MSLIPPLVVIGASLPFLWFLPALTLPCLLAYIAYYYFSPLEEHEVVQSLPVGPFDDNVEGQPRRHPRFTGGLLTRPGNEIRSLADILYYSQKKYGDKPALGLRSIIRTEARETTVKGSDGTETKKIFQIPYLTNYQWRTYRDVYDEAVLCAAGLISITQSSAPLEFGSRIALFASTRPEWITAFHGAMQVGITVCTVYPSLGAEALVFSLSQTNVSHVVTEAKLIETLLKGADRLPSLKVIIYFDELKNKATLAAKYPNLKFINYEELLNSGRKNPLLPNQKKPTENDLAIIMYTSGSTGNPKGVMLSHGNILAMTAGVLEAIPDGPNADDTYIAFLPLAHVLELCAESALLYVGGTIGYASPTTLRDEQAFSAETGKGAGDLTMLRPTLMAAVPLILDRLQTGIMDNVAKAGPVVRKLFDLAFWLKRRAYMMGQTSPLSDVVVFNKIKAKFGGRLRFMLSGGAPLSAQTQLFINVTLGCPVLQGYGLTETTAGGTICHPDDRTYAKVGGPLPSTELKLIDVPEMGYTHKDKNEAGQPTPRGEIAIRGPTVSQGYFMMPEKTESDFVKTPYNDSPYRWFLTGDIGQLLPDGSFKIIDRKKDLVKLAHGEYIALGNLESVYSHSPAVDQICVYGDADHTSPVALVVVNHRQILQFAEALNLNTNDVESLCSNKQISKKVLEALNEAANKARLEKWERVTAVHLIANPWTPESGLLTEAMKLKRHEITKTYKKQLEQVYTS